MTSRLLVDKIEGKTSSGTIQMPSGFVVQTATNKNTDGTNITASDSFVHVTASVCSITSKLANSSFLYTGVLSVESDITTSPLRNFVRMRYTVNGGSAIIHDNANVFQVEMPRGDNDIGQVAINYLFDGITHSAGTVFRFSFQYRQNTTGSYFFNQQSLANQPSGTSNMSHITVQEIAP